MSGIKSKIELYDAFSAPMMDIVNAVNQSVVAIDNMQHTMNGNINTASIQNMSTQMQEAANSARELESSIQNIGTPSEAAPMGVSQDLTVDVTPVVTEQPVIDIPKDLTVDIIPDLDIPNSIAVNAEAVITEAETNLPNPIEIPAQMPNPPPLDTASVQQYENEINSVNNMLQMVIANQQGIEAQSRNISLLPQEEKNNLKDIQNSIAETQQAMIQLQNTPIDVDAEGVQSQLASVSESISSIINKQNNLNQAMQSMQMPDVWKSDNLEVFNTSGIERFKQEIQSASTMLNTLNTTQQQISTTAAQIDLLPENAVADINNMQNRLLAIQQRIQQIESNPLNVGSDVANAGLEQLRNNLDRAIQEQQNLNNAVERMDVSGANEAYLRLSSTIGNTEQYIRDNVTEQGQFNREIEEGTNEANSLMGAIKGAVAVYATIHTVTSALDLSDQLTSTTARLNLMNDGLQNTEQLQQMIFASAERSRGAYQTTADAVSKLGLMAGDAFNSTAEIVAFTEQLNKQFTIAGTEAAGIDAAMLQLTQAMGSGILRGEEYNSILEQAPNIIQSIADYMEVPKGQLKDMAAEGQITADIVKNAMFAAAEETNAQFESMPQTFAQIWTSFKNNALMAFQPVLQRLNQIANSEAFQTFVNQAINALAKVADIVLNIFDLVASVGGFIADNWSIIEPIIMGIVTALGLYYGAMLLYNTVTKISAAITAAQSFAATVHAASLAMQTGATFAATAAQYGFNAALLACPITWILIAIIAVVVALYAAVAAINEICGTTISATGIIMGAIFTIGAYIINKFILAWNIISAFIEFLVNVWKHPQYAIKAFIVNVVSAFLNFVLACINGTQSAVGTIVGLWYAFSQAVANVIVVIYNFFADGIEAVVNGWNTGIYTIKTFFVGLASAAMSVASSILSSMGQAASGIANMFIGAINAAIGALNGLIDAMNAIPGVNIGKVGELGQVSFDFGASALQDTASGLLDEIGAAPEKWEAPELETGSIGDAFTDGYMIGQDMVSGAQEAINGTINDMQNWLGDKPDDYWEAPKVDYINLSDAAVTGYEWGKGLEDKASEMFNPESVNDIADSFASAIDPNVGSGGLGSDVGDIADNTGAIADSVSMSDEELKYLRDIAEQEAINRYTTAEITINQENHNNISSDSDIDGIVSGLTDAMEEAAEIATEGE